jgi:SMODS-associated and fused to various effectors sensor domain
MADAVTARWHGDNYQARIFWENAFNLLDASSCVVEVSFEADGPKAFDDVVVKYDPPVARSGPNRISAEYHQVKWHVERGGRFGYEDFIDPAFIGASSISLLQRLKDAKVKTPDGAYFTFLTTYRVRDDDPLSGLIAGTDRTLLVERLFDGTTDRSRMGKVRKCWRDHLGLAADEELAKALQGLRIVDGHRSLDELRSQINLKAQVVGVLAFSDADSDFRYDELARQLKVRQLNTLTKELFLKVCREEGLLVEPAAGDDAFLAIAVRSFLGPAADIVGASPDNTLLLTADFRHRYLQEGREWQKDIQPKVEAFLQGAVKKSGKLRLILDAHASIAFLSGAVLHLKSGVETHLVQKGRVGQRIWHPMDGSEATTERFEAHEEVISRGQDIAIALGVSQPVTAQVRAYVGDHLPSVGKVISFSFAGGPSQHGVRGGGHAVVLADQIATHLRTTATLTKGVVHIFAAAPNSLLFYLGQQHQALGACVVYEFDFDRAGNRSYHPSFMMS